MKNKRKSRKVFKGGVPVGGGASVTVQSMTNTHTEDIDATVGQINSLARMGCQIIRVAAPTEKAADAIAEIKRQISIPLVADIHFSGALAVRAIKAGADCVRINPGNMRDWRDVRKVVRAAAEAGISLRLGVNSGSIRERRGMSIVRKQKRGAEGEGLAALMVDTVLRYCERIEKMGFNRLVLSLKASDVPTTIECYRSIAKKCDYPLHLGLTAAGPYSESVVKSSVAIGSLLADGIGDTIRVSVTGPPESEVIIGHQILKALGLEERGLEVFSCPTCGRCDINLDRIVRAVRAKTAHIKKNVSVAIMGCVVNGPGEAAEADIGIAGGKGFAYLFKKGVKVRRLDEAEIVPALVAEIEKM
jgi:(E)-4-hydroxy-3-methylbut-2-enyl-diphosphate synthase